MRILQKTASASTKRLRFFILSLAYCLASSLTGCTPQVTGSLNLSQPATSPIQTETPAPAESTCSSVTYAAPSGASNTISFTFDKPYTCGQFVNGDWWIASDANGTATITGILPHAIQAKAGPGKWVHGFELNPSALNQQGFDADMSYAPYSATLDKTSALPLTVSTATGIQSVVKAVSIGTPFEVTGSISGTTLTITSVSGAPRAIAVGDTISGTGVTSTKITAIPAGGGIGSYTITASQTVGSSTILISKPDARPKLRFAAVLTIVSDPIADSSKKFRPAYFGALANKKFYTVDEVDHRQLPGYAVDSSIGSSLISAMSSTPLTTVANTFAHLRMDHYSGWPGRYMHPADAMPDYGSDIANQNHAYLGRLLLSDFDISNSTHQKALYGYLQSAIDLRSIVLGGTRFFADGGHFAGRKLPLLFAEKMFGDLGADFRAAIAAHEAAGKFQEDGHTFYSATVPGLALWGKSGNDGQYWAEIRTGSGSRDVRDPYGYIDGGSPGYNSDYPTIGAQGNSYQVCCTSNQYKYAVVVARMLNLQTAWNWPALFEYADRWVTSGVVASPDPMAPYDDVPANYNITYGAGKFGAGRVPLNHGTKADAAYYGSATGNALWTWWSQYNPAFLGFKSVTSQPVSTVIFSNWARSHFTGSVSVSGGEYRIASDSNGNTILYDWTSSNGSVTSGQYVQVRRTSSSTSATQVNVTLSLSGFANIFNITTQ